MVEPTTARGENAPDYVVGPVQQLLNFYLRKKKAGEPRKDISSVTVIALTGILTVREIAKIMNCSRWLIRKIQRGERRLEEGDRIDAQLLKKHGLRVCGCCRERVVPLEPVNGVKLTRLCLLCYKQGEVGAVARTHGTPFGRDLDDL